MIESEPKASIIIPTLGRETLYPLIDNLLEQEVGFSFEIVLIPQVTLKEELLNDSRIRYFYEQLGKGFAYYRNKGINESKGDVVVFIDDDELPMNNLWLDCITAPILKGEEDVATAGVYIKLGEGYLTDSISLLGFPGGGAIGFKTMWNVDENNVTEHLCSGNLAINKNLLNKLSNFSNEYKHGKEDVNLADKLIQNNIKIKYIEEATVYHVARKGYVNFIKWNMLRGKSSKEYVSINKGGSKIMNRFSSSLRILKKVSVSRTRYLPGVSFMMFSQYLWELLGALRK
jgi:glycosyltransferase involved in cell wall biosynthesis